MVKGLVISTFFNTYNEVINFLDQVETDLYMHNTDYTIDIYYIDNPNPFIPNNKLEGYKVIVKM